MKDRLSVLPVSIQTTPPGADIHILDYADTTEGAASRWERLGRSPLNTDQIPAGYYRIMAVKDGFEKVERAVSIESVATTLQVQLQTKQVTPTGMVWVPGIERDGLGSALFPVLPMELPGFWIDRHEVTNRQYGEFVEAAGYQKREYWKHPFIKDGKVLSFDEGMLEFRDTTGRPGPLAWQLGTYPEEKADHPVEGVSWYEAAAYAEFSRQEPAHGVSLVSRR
jgi:eukaryotic-like serine/threonine-protein kinase